MTFGLFRFYSTTRLLARLAPRFASLLLASTLGLFTAQSSAEATGDDGETSERSVIYRHYL